MNIKDFHDELNDLLEAKKLLDEILAYYDVYSQQFEIIPGEKYPLWNGASGSTSRADELNKKIREYIKFDDFE